MDHTLAELVEQNSRLLLEKKVLEGIVEDKNRRLVEVQAAYLMMMVSQFSRSIIRQYDSYCADRIRSKLRK